MTREQAITLLKDYNTEPFHLKHALTVEGVMKYFADAYGYGSYMTSTLKNIRKNTASRSRRSYGKPALPKS